MDWTQIILALLGAGGLLGSGGLVGHYLAHRKTREEAVDQRYQRLVDELQKETIRTSHMADRLRERQETAATQLAASQTHIATLHQELAQEREQRLETERRYAGIEERHRAERAADAQRIAALEAEVARLQTLTAEQEAEIRRLRAKVYIEEDDNARTTDS